jgi:DNA-binding transcriptional ArsR family regulator
MKEKNPGRGERAVDLSPDQDEDRKRGEILEIFEGLSSGIRLDIFRLLVTWEPDGLVAGEISGKLSIPPTNLSFHLKTLTYAGLVSVEQQGRFLRYRARVQAVTDVIAFLTDNCCSNNPEHCPPGSPGKQNSPSRRF